MITPKQLRELRNNKGLSIGDAWNALGEAADRIEELEEYIRSSELENMDTLRDDYEHLEFVKQRDREMEDGEL